MKRSDAPGWLPGLLIALAMQPGEAGGAPPQFDDPTGGTLFALYYDFEVAGYCGLVSDAVGRGFQALAQPLVDAHALGRPAVDVLRGKAWQAAHEEWQNRGLGGYRAWCRGAGRAAAERLAAAAPGAPPVPGNAPGPAATRPPVATEH